MFTAAWSIADAKSRLSEVLNRAEQQPQVITRRGHRFVLVAAADYARLIGATPSMKDLILKGPSLEGVDLTRDASAARGNVSL